jgi:hypothetical protein
LNSFDIWDLLEERSSKTQTTKVGDSTSIRLVPTPVGRIEYTFERPFDYTQSSLSVWVYIPDAAPERLQFRLSAPDTENQLVTTRYPSDSMTETWFGIEIGPMTEIGSPDPTAITRLQIEVRGERTPVVFDRFETMPVADTGRAMVIFDDNRASVATAYTEMSRRGIPGAVAVIPALVGAEGHLNERQLERYDAHGWDLLAHPQLDNPLPAYSPSEQRMAILQTKQWLVANGYEEGADHFVAPYGKIGPKTLELLTEFHHTNYLTSPGLSGTLPADPLTIDRVAIDDVQNAKRQVELAARYNRTVALMAHTVGREGDQWVSEHGFREVLDKLTSSGIDVVTPTEYWSAAIDPRSEE